MPSAQPEPPKLSHWAPKWMHVLWDDLCAYLKDTRPVPGQNVTITDAPGGGKLISAGPEGLAGGTEQLYIAVVGIVDVYDVVATKHEEEE